MSMNFFPATEENFRICGRWDSRNIDGKPVFLSFTMSAMLLFRTEGVKQLSFRFESTAKLGLPAYALSVDGGEWIRKSLDESEFSLPDSGSHSVRLVLESIMVDEDRWEGENGVLFFGAETDGGKIFADSEKKKILAVFGDSIAEGYSVLKAGNTIDAHSAVQSFPMVAAEKLGMIPYVVAYGWTGILHPRYVAPCSQMIRWFSHGHRVAPAEPDIVILEHGDNDEDYAEEEFEAAYRGTLSLLLLTFPKAKVYSMIPIHQVFAPVIQRVAEEFDGAVTLMPTAELEKTCTYTDNNTHPDAVSAAKIGQYAADFISDTKEGNKE